MRLPAVLLLLSIVALPALAQTDVEQELASREAEQRLRIAQARAAVQDQLRIREAACYQRFAVNDCLTKSRRAAREVLSDLRRQEIVINDAQRKRRGAEQLLRSDELLDGKR